MSAYRRDGTRYMRLSRSIEFKAPTPDIAAKKSADKHDSASTMHLRVEELFDVDLDQGLIVDRETLVQSYFDKQKHAMSDGEIIEVQDVHVGVVSLTRTRETL